MDWERDDHTRTCVEVYYNDRGLEWDDSGQSAMPKDIYNAPYARKGGILRGLGFEPGGSWNGKQHIRKNEPVYGFFLHIGTLPNTMIPYHRSDVLWLKIASQVHDIEMIRYLRTAWDRWKGMPMENRCKFFRARKMGSPTAAVPALVPSNFAQRSEPGSKAGTDVHSQTNWYHTDDETPVFEGLPETLESDILVVLRHIGRCCCGEIKPQSRYFYALVTHPGHHAGKSSIGGYCYVNIAALIAHLILHPAYEDWRKKSKVRRLRYLTLTTTAATAPSRSSGTDPTCSWRRYTRTRAATTRGTAASRIRLEKDPVRARPSICRSPRRRLGRIRKP